MTSDAAEKLKQANIELFKNIAKNYENDSTKLVAKVAAENILQFTPESNQFSKSNQIVRSNKPEACDEGAHFEIVGNVPDVNTALWTPSRTRVLDFACGTGLLSKNLAPYAKEIVGVDISQDMVGYFNSTNNFPNVSAHVIDVTKETELDAQFTGFDAIVTSLAYHHIHDIEGTTKRLTELLNKDGYLYVSDTDVGSGSFHGTMTDADCLQTGTSYRYGMEADHLIRALEDAGLINVKVIRAIPTKAWLPQDNYEGATGLTGKTKTENGTKFYEHKMNLILAVGQKP